MTLQFVASKENTFAAFEALELHQESDFLLKIYASTQTTTEN